MRRGGEGRWEQTAALGENRYEVHACAHVLCVCVCGCVTMNAPRMVICSGWGWAAAVAAAWMWGENEKASTRAGRLFKPNIKADGGGCGGAISVLSIISSLISRTGINYMSHETQRGNNYWCFMFVWQSLSSGHGKDDMWPNSIGSAVMCLNGFMCGLKDRSPGNTNTHRVEETTVWSFQVQHIHVPVRNWSEGQRSGWTPHLSPSPSLSHNYTTLFLCFRFSEWTRTQRWSATRSLLMLSFRW